MFLSPVTPILQSIKSVKLVALIVVDALALTYRLVLPAQMDTILILLKHVFLAQKDAPYAQVYLFAYHAQPVMLLKLWHL